MPSVRGARLPWIAAGVLLGSLAGCVEPTAAPSATAPAPLGAQERMDVEQRARALLDKAARSDVDAVASNAVEALVKVAPKESTDAFRAAARSNTPIVRYAGLVALGDVRDRGAMQLLEKARNDPDPRVRLAAMYAMYRCGKREAGRALSKALTDGPDENVRGAAIDLVGRLQEPAPIKRLKAALRAPVNQKSNRLIVQIYAAMAMLGDKDALGHLQQYSQGDVVARVIALQTLAEIGNSETRDALRYRLSKEDEYIEHRLLAAAGLGKMGSKDGLDLALRSTTHEPKDPQDTEATWRVPALAARALGDIGDKSALPRLRQMAEDNDPRVQVAACYAICRIMAR